MFHSAGEKQVGGADVLLRISNLECFHCIGLMGSILWGVL